jgi:hypothetical protein
MEGQTADDLGDEEASVDDQGDGQRAALATATRPMGVTVVVLSPVPNRHYLEM